MTKCKRADCHFISPITGEARLRIVMIAGNPDHLPIVDNTGNKSDIVGRQARRRIIVVKAVAQRYDGFWLVTLNNGCKTLQSTLTVIGRQKLTASGKGR